MRIQGSKKVHYDSGPNMTPLVDIVMVILIFLMLAGSFGATEHYILSTTPLTPEGPSLAKDTKILPDPLVDINVDNTGGGYLARASGLPAVSDGPALKEQLIQLKIRLSGGTLGRDDKDDKHQVAIHPDEFVKWQFLIDVYQSALEAGFTKVGFTTAHQVGHAP